MRRFFLLLAAFGLIATPAIAARTLVAPERIAVYVSADWCPNCKVLAPTLEKARSANIAASGRTLFVTMDFTDKPRIRQSLLHAQALGIGAYVQAQGSAVGYVAILDAVSKKELARFDRDATADAISKSLR